MHPKNHLPLFRALSFSLLFTLSGITSAASFSDVSPDHSNNKAITYAEDQAIVSGYSDHTYHPDATINRAEFTKIIVGATLTKENIDSCQMGGDLLTGYIKDIPLGQWYTPYICAALYAEYAYGYPDGTFRPEQSINFVEAAKILSNAYRFRPSDDKEIWYRPYVQELAARQAIPLSITSFDQKITRGEMAEMIWRLKAGITDRRSHTYEELADKKNKPTSADMLTISFKDTPKETQMVFYKDNGWEFTYDLPLPRPISYMDPSVYANGELAAFYGESKGSRVWYVLTREGTLVYVDIASEGRDQNTQAPCLVSGYHVMLFTLEKNKANAEGYDYKVTSKIPPHCAQNP